jgi:small ligand-binding sensory domain FIST
MSMRFAAALSNESETVEAVDEALGELGEAMGAGPIDLAMVFATPHHRQRFQFIADQLQDRFAPRAALGATAAGVLAGGRELDHGAGLSVMLGRLPGVGLHTFTQEQLSWPDSSRDFGALRRAITGRDDDAAPAGVILLADPFSTPMVKLMPALNAALPGVPIIGGMASGASHHGDNRLMLGERVMVDGAVGVAISGDVRIDCTVSQGCRPIGQPWVITRARNNVIQELGRRPVLSALQTTAEEVDEADRPLLEQGVFVGRVIDEYKDHFDRGDFLIRSIVGADREAGYLAVGDLVRVGQTIQFHVRDARTAEEDLRLLLDSQRSRGPAAGALLCTCNGRGSNMFDRPDAESSIIRSMLGADLPLAGFFAAGEIGPIGRENFLHGFTASLAVFRPIASPRTS